MLVTPDEMRAALDLPVTVADDDLNAVCEAASSLVESLLVPGDYTANAAVREAALAVAGQIWQQRQAPGGAMTGYDLQVSNPYLLGPGLVRRIDGIIAPWKAPGVLVG